MLKEYNGISGKVLLLAGVGIAHKREVYDTLDGLSWYFRGFKKVTQLPFGGGLYATHAP